MLAMREAHENASEDLPSVFLHYPVRGDEKMMCGRYIFRRFLPDWSENNGSLYSTASTRQFARKVDTESQLGKVNMCLRLDQGESLVPRAI